MVSILHVIVTPTKVPQPLMNQDGVCCMFDLFLPCNNHEVGDSCYSLSPPHADALKFAVWEFVDNFPFMDSTSDQFDKTVRRWLLIALGVIFAG